MMEYLSFELVIGLLLIGVTLLVAVFYLRIQSKRLNRYLLSLNELNQQVDQDVLVFIDQAWLILQAAGFKSLQGDVLWFGERKAYDFGHPSVQSYPVSIIEGDIQIHLNLSSAWLSGEAELMALLVRNHFQTLLSLDAASKMSQFFLSQKRLEKYQLFMQHDIKNLAQFLQLLSEQVTGADSDAEKVRLVARLQKILPAISEKSKQLLNQMMDSQSGFSEIAVVDVAEQIRQIASGLEVAIQLQGKLTCQVSKAWLYQVIKNILENFRDHLALTSCVEVRLTEGGEISFLSQQALEQQVEFSERWFEPFWTTSESGLGLGLFIVRDLLEKAGGAVNFQQVENGWGFKIDLPKQFVVNPVL